MHNLRHDIELQSLRGIAALVVLVHHTSYFYPIPHHARVVFDTLINAHAAIVFFFVLSGFVLALSVMRFGSTFGFYIKRAFRILPAFWLTTAICSIYILSFGSEAGSQVLDWPRGMIIEPSWTPKIIFYCLGGLPFLIGSAYTVVAEILGSAAIPPLLYVSQAKIMYGAMMIAVLGGLSFWFYDAPDATRYLMFMVHFALGVFVALILRRNPAMKIGVSLTAVFSFGLIFSRQVVMIVYSGSPQDLDYEYHFPANGLLEGLFSAALVLAVTTRRDPILRLPPLTWIGNISYGIYLLHLPALFLSARFAGAVGVKTAPVQFVILITLTLLITLPSATLMYRFVEKPCIAVGERLAARKFSRARMKPAE